MGVSDESTILLVDDEAVVRQVAERILKRAGYSVTTAPDGETALAILRQAGSRVALVMLDLQMPGMGGAACLARLRELDATLPIIVTTGGEPDAETEVGLRAAAQAIVRKPYDVQRLLAIVGNLLDRTGGGAAEARS